MNNIETAAYFADPGNYTLEVFTDPDLMADYNRFQAEIDSMLSTLPDSRRATIFRRKSEVMQRIATLYMADNRMRTAAELARKDIPPIDWIVEGVLPVGLAMLGAPSKYYKSFMALDLCASVCTGADFLGQKTVKASCLYLDLESTERRPRERLNLILGEDAPKPDNLFILTALDGVQRIGDGFQEQIAWILRNHRDIKLIVIDVLQLVRQPARNNQTGYDRDYEDFRQLKELADKHNICILLIHHTRKMRDQNDVFNELSGSTGVLGALDCAWLISKEKRFDDEAVLNITGRDLESRQMSIQFDKAAFRWHLLGNAEDIQEQRRRDEYRRSPVVQTIKKLLDVSGGSWTGTMRELISASAYIHTWIKTDEIRTAKELLKYTEFFSKDGITVIRKVIGHNNRITYDFKTDNPFITNDEAANLASIANLANIASTANLAEENN